MQLNTNIYKEENFRNLSTNNITVVDNSFTTYKSSDESYEYLQPLNKLFDISFCIGMSKGDYSLCRLANITVQKDLAITGKILYDTSFVRQDYTYYCINELENVGQIYLDGTDYHEYGYNVAESYQNARYIAQYWRPYVKFIYTDVIITVEFWCYKTLHDVFLDDHSVRATLTLDKFGKGQWADYKYCNGFTINLVGRYGGNYPSTPNTSVFQNILNIKDVERYVFENSTLKKVDVYSNLLLTRSKVTLNEFYSWFTEQGTIKNYSTIAYCPKPFSAIVDEDSGNYALIAGISDDEEVLNEFRKMISCFGMIWAESRDAINEISGGIKSDYSNATDKIYFPLKTDEGFFIGDYVKGKKISENITPEMQTPDQWQKDNGVKENPDTNNYVKSIDLNHPTLSTLGVFNRCYAINAKSVTDLSKYLWNSDSTIFNQIIESLKLMGENPMNALIDLRMFPFDVSKKLKALDSEFITLGRQQTTVSGLKIPNEIDCIFDLGQCNYPSFFNNFLDFAPFSECELVIPYCGKIVLNPEDFLGKTLKVKMIIDLVTGSCSAVVFADNLPIFTKTGNCAVDVNMTGNISTEYAKSYINAITAAVPNVSNVENTPVQSSLNIANNLASGFLQPTYYQSVGNNSSSVNTYLPQKCYLIIKSPQTNVPENYGTTVGYACSFKEKLQNLSGYTVVSNPQILFNCSSAEKNEIKRILQNGFYI